MCSQLSILSPAGLSASPPGNPPGTAPPARQAALPDQSPLSHPFRLLTLATLQHSARFSCTPRSPKCRLGFPHITQLHGCGVSHLCPISPLQYQRRRRRMRSSCARRHARPLFNASRDVSFNITVELPPTVTPAVPMARDAYLDPRTPGNRLRYVNRKNRTRRSLPLYRDIQTVHRKPPTPTLLKNHAATTSSYVAAKISALHG